MSKNGSKSDVGIVYCGVDKWSFETAKIAASRDHAVLFQLPIPRDGESLTPYRSVDLWDNYHVRMPCSGQSKYIEVDESGTKIMKNRWNLIEQSLLIDFNSSYDLEKAIKAYNTRYSSWSFASLHNFVNNALTQQERNQFLRDLLPKIVRLALRMPHIIQCPIPLLKQGVTRSISMTQEQAGCILANCFLCTFPRRNTTKRDAEFANYPEINFNRLYNSDIERVNQKLYCILNYFDRVVNAMPRGVVTFSRRSLTFDQLPDWRNSVKTLCNIKYYISSNERIENAAGMLQVDFANRFIGGGVLGNGLVQEEIRFLINPELIVSKLFTECLNHEETIVIIGAEQFSSYSGYASTFKFGGNYFDTTPCDESRRKRCNIVAIDALPYKNNADQFQETNLLRELNKAYTGFFNENHSMQPISSGFWGAGAFQGNPIKAALIQLMACREARRNLAFFTFGDIGIQQTIFELFATLAERGVTIGKLFQILKQFNPSGADAMDLAAFVNEKTKLTASEAAPLLKIQPKTQPKINDRLFQSFFKSSFDYSSSSSSTTNGNSLYYSEKTDRLKEKDSMVDFESLSTHSNVVSSTTAAVPRTKPVEEKKLAGPSLLDRLDDDFFSSK